MYSLTEHAFVNRYHNWSCLVLLTANGVAPRNLVPHPFLLPPHSPHSPLSPLTLLSLLSLSFLLSLSSHSPLTLSLSFHSPFTLLSLSLTLLSYRSLTLLSPLHVNPLAALGRDRVGSQPGHSEVQVHRLTFFWKVYAFFFRLRNDSGEDMSASTYLVCLGLNQSKLRHLCDF